MVEIELQSARRGMIARRLAIGLFQGLALFLLHRTKAELAPAAAGALWLTLLLVPIVALGGLGRLGRGLLFAWLAASALITAALGAYDRFVWVQPGAPPAYFPSPALLLLTATALFILHQLITATAAERRWRASYERYFDEGWMDAVRLALATAFVGALWLLLLLGAELFRLIGVDLLARLIRRDWFGFPVTAVFFALAVHITDVRSELVRGARLLALTLLSWLAPVLAGLTAVFLLATPFTGLAPLWATRSAGGTLLAVCGALIVLINAVYQDGRSPAPAALRWSARVAGVALAPLAAIAIYGLALRIGQHGLSPARVHAAAALLVAAAYAIGYFWAAVSPGPWLKRLEGANWACAHLVVIVLVLILSPVLDPARLAVADQMRRLEGGSVGARAFDYSFLHFSSGRWGRAELERLAAGQRPRAPASAAAAAREELKVKNRWDARAATAPERRETIHAAAGPLPAGFLEQSWSAEADPAHGCGVGPAACEAIVGELDGQPGQEIAVVSGVGVRVFGQRNGRWAEIGVLYGASCPGDREAVREGRFRFQPPAPRRELEIAGRRLAFGTTEPCPGVSREPPPRRP